jgi:hypothetical protein
MGLDQYAYAAARAGQYQEFWETADAVTTAPEGHAEYVSDTVRRPREFGYWRKHPNLHGWMERLWSQRGCPGYEHLLDASFNGVELELTWADIDDLEQAILNRELPPTQGFFFGDNSDEYYRDRDLEFCREARAALFLGERVFYNSSW